MVWLLGRDGESHTRLAAAADVVVHVRGRLFVTLYACMWQIVLVVVVVVVGLFA